MNEHSWMIKEEREVLDYRIIRGFPADVEKEAQLLLKMKWQPYGKMYKMKAPGENNDIVVQCMVLYDEQFFC